MIEGLAIKVVTFIIVLVQKVYVIAGPTASGKSAHALEIAQKQPAVIINADSQQVYRDFPILTAQPSPAEQQLTPHFLYGFLDINQKCDAATWAKMAAAEIQTAWANGQLPILVGGTGLYLKTLMQGISPVPDIPTQIRTQATALLNEIGNAAFHAMLIAKDPTSAHLHIGDTQRILRAYEVVEFTGKPLVYWHKQPTKTFLENAQYAGKILLPDRQALYANCNTRFSQMLENGAIEEVKRYDLNHTIKIIGAPEIQSYLRGEISLEMATEKGAQASRNYAKRQYTWFRNQKML